MKLNSVTREEFIRFFLYAADHKGTLDNYLKLLNKQQNELTNITINDVLGDMFNHLDNKLKDPNGGSEQWTFRKYFLQVLGSFKQNNPDDVLALLDSKRSPWPSVLMVIFWLTGTGVAYFIYAWSINNKRIDCKNNKIKEECFTKNVRNGIENIIIASIFVCSLIFGWTLWIQIPVGIIFVVLELGQLLCIKKDISACRAIRRVTLSSEEYKYLLAKVENHLRQGKDDNDNKEIKEKELKKEYKNKPKEEVYQENQNKDGDNIPTESEVK